MPTTTKPLARKNDLQVQTVADETLVYDTLTDKAYVLSASAAAVWQACNGKRSVSEIANYLSETTPTDEQVVWYALEQLNDLLVEPATVPQNIAGMSRRQFLTRGLVAGAVAIPVVVSMVAPKPAHAQSVVGEFCCDCNSAPGKIVGSCAECTTFCDDKGGVKGCEECV